MLHQSIKDSIKEAMLSRDANRLTVLRNMVSAFTNELIATNRKPTEMLSDTEVLAVIKRLARQRKDSIEQFTKGNREDLVKIEEAELAILETFLPQQVGRDEIEKVAKEKKESLGITDKSKSGILVGAIVKEFAGSADGGLVKEVVDSLFV